MTDPTIEPTTEDDQTVLDALAAADPADAPDIAEGLAAGLQRELDQTGAKEPDAGESDS